MRLSASDVRVKGLRLSRNFGYQANILTGYLNASGAAVVQMDSDGEDPPAVIVEFVRQWEEGYDVVYGIRLTRQESPFLQWQRRLFYSMLNRITSLRLPPGAGDFRLLDRVVITTLCERFGERDPYLRGLVSFIGFRQIGVPYHRGKRMRGPSKFSYFDYMRLAWDAITSFSQVPLKLIAMAGFCLSGISMLASVFYLGLYITGNIAVKGFTTLILILLFVSGVQLLCLGILGEYIARIFEEVKMRPRSIVTDSCGFSTPPRNA
jgi:dolichol-phosphate mannosyltransferase